jgi:hypothetical protein
MMKEYAAETGLTGYRKAVALALGKERDGQVETTWANAGADADPLPSDPQWAGHKVYVDERTFHGDVDPSHVWTIIEGIGGRNGWYSLPLAWSVRGWLDKLSGGAGLLRGRRAPVPQPDLSCHVPQHHSGGPEDRRCGRVRGHRVGCGEQKAF